MKTYKQWMDDYGVDHNHPTNQKIHKVCVPLIMFSIIGLLWCVPRVNVEGFNINWAYVLIALALIFYVTLRNFKMLLMMILQTGVMVYICHLLNERSLLLPVSITIFVLAWIGQFIGHKIEGRKPSFLQDISFLLIGPLWVNRFLFKKWGVED